MSVLNYDISIDPAQPNLYLEIIVENSTVKIKMNGYEDFSVLCVPSGSVIQEVFSAIAWPIAQLITNDLLDDIKDDLDKNYVGQTKDVTDIPNIPFSHEGVTVTLKPSNVTLSNFNGMLMADAAIDIV